MPRPALLFDIGNVLLRFDFRLAAKRFSDQSQVAPDEVIALLSPFKEGLESGALPDQEFVTLSMERIKFRGSPEEFAGIWADIFTPNEPMIQLVEAIGEKTDLYLLSNTNGIHKDYFLARFPVFRHFAGGVYSHEARVMKPDEAIYRLAMERFSLDPQRTYYIDDLVDNIVTGRRLGLISHHYDLNRHEALETELHDWLSANS